MCIRDRSNRVYIDVDEENFETLFFPKIEGDDEFLEEILFELAKTDLFSLVYKKKYDFSPLSRRFARIVINPEKENFLRKFYNREIIEGEWSKAFSSHVFKSDKAEEILGYRPIQIKGKSSSEVIERFDNWASLAPHSGTIRQESARCFWGLSKVFDNRTDIIEAFNLRELPVMLNVHIKSESADEVLFIENLDTFYECVSTGNPVFKNMILVYASGYRASAKRLRSKNGNKMFFDDTAGISEEKKEEFRTWVNKENEDVTMGVFFWGDLDYSGIGIYKALKEIFPEARMWEPGYEASLSLLAVGHCHAPESAGKENQTKIPFLGDDFVDEVFCKGIEACNKFVDQEAVEIEKIKNKEGKNIKTFRERALWSL